MPKPGRPPVLDQQKRTDIIKILASGASQTAAARYVGCATRTIRDTIARDPVFAEQVERALGQNELSLVAHLRTAAAQEKYWRATAWMLERLNPQQFGKRDPDLISIAQMSQLMAALVDIVCDEVPVAAFRTKIVKRFQQLQQRIQPLGDRLRLPSPANVPGEK